MEAHDVITPATMESPRQEAVRSPAVPAVDASTVHQYIGVGGGCNISSVDTMETVDPGPRATKNVVPAGATTAPPPTGIARDVVDMHAPNSAREPPSCPSRTFMHCPVSCLRVEGRSQLIAHLRTTRDAHHKSALTESSPVYQELRGLHVMPCPLGCGAVYDGGRTGTSRHYDAHVEKRGCRKSDTSGPWCATTVMGIHSAAREWLAAGANGPELVNASNAITYCLLHSGFMRHHIKHGRVTTSTRVPLPGLDFITATATYVM